PPGQLRMQTEIELEGPKAADYVLRRIGPVDAEDEPLGAGRSQVLLVLEHRLAPCELLELGRVDRDRPRRDPCPSVAVLERLALLVPLGAGDRLAGGDEVLRPAARVEADEVVREQAVVDAPADP